jgi:ABC-2 type transport system permease protein
MSDRHGGPLAQLTLWRVRELFREPEAIFWVFAFPVLLSIALGIAFRSRSPQAISVAVQNAPGAEALVAALDSAPGLRAELLDSAEAHDRLRTGRVALVVIPGQPIVFRFDSTRDESHLARLRAMNAIEAASGRRDVVTITDVKVTEKGSRYIDFLIPGLIGLNIMGTGMWGLGFGTVRMRTKNLLKRLLSSPMRKSHFLAAQIFARLVFLPLEVGAVLLFGVIVFGIPVRGSLIGLTVISLLGAMTFAGLGLLTASRAKTIEGVSGLMNVVMVPMWILSGVFFSWSHFPDALQPFIRALPLTALNDALRANLLDGASITSSLGLLGIVAAWGIVSFGVALKIFRWK